MGSDRRAGLVAAVRRSVLEAPGLTSTDRRRRAYDGEADGGGEHLEAYLAMVHARSAYISDRLVDDARADGVSDDELFELTIAAATGEALRRLDAGLRALGVAE